MILKRRKRMKMKEIEDVSFEEGLQFKDCCNLLIIVATDIERRTVLSALLPLKKQNSVYRVQKDNLTYYLGTYGVYGAILVKSTMGIATAGGAILTTNTAIDVWKPKAIVMIGIAFGIDDEKQSIGDVLVSEQVIPYGIKRVGKSLSVFRSAHPPASPFLRNRFSEV